MTRPQINNDIYNNFAHTWWDEGENVTLSSLRYFINDVRFHYIENLIKNYFQEKFKEKSILDVGCGGGFLSEEFSKIGCKITGIDISKNSIKEAKVHALLSGLEIDYMIGKGESLPFLNNSFDIIYCCDVLEHIESPILVLKEISRVLKNNGLFFYDTINRTLISNLMSIKVMQEWKNTAFVEPNVHVWRMFIKPLELMSMMDKNNLINKEIKGLSPSLNFIGHYFNLRKAARGKITYKELAKRMNFHLTNNLSNSYIGYAMKVFRCP